MKVYKIVITGILVLTALFFYRGVTVPLVFAQPTVNIVTGTNVTPPFDLTFTVIDRNGLTNLDPSSFELFINGEVISTDIVGALSSGAAQLKAVSNTKATITYPRLNLFGGDCTIGIGIQDLAGNKGGHEVTLRVNAHGESLPTMANPDEIFSAIAERALIKRARTKGAEEVHHLLDDNMDGNIDAQDNPSNDPFIMDVRSRADYEWGHIPTAVNIPFDEVPEKLALLPKDRDIVIVSSVQHLATQANMLLNMLGYANAYALKWGMAGWTTDSTIVPDRFTKDSRSNNNQFPLAPKGSALLDGPTYGYPIIHTPETKLVTASIEEAVAGGTIEVANFMFQTHRCHNCHNPRDWSRTKTGKEHEQIGAG